MDVASYVLSKKYVEDTLNGAGALAGKSAYELACENGFKGTPTEWLASLKGDTPQIGSSGTWVISGIDTGVLASPSIAGYATEEYVNQQIASIPEIDLTPYATRKELSEAILGIVIPDVSNFVVQKDIDRAIAAIKFPEPDLTPYAKKNDIPSIAGLASETYVDNAIASIKLPDLAPYALKSEIPNIKGLASEEYVAQKIAEAELNNKEVDLSAYATKEELQEAINNIEHPVVDLSEYAKKDELPSLAGLATEQFVQDKIGEIKFPSADLTGYATEEYVRQKIAEAQMSGDVEVDLSDYYTKTEIDAKFDNIDIPEVDLTGLATESYVDEAINSIVIPSTDGLATEEFVEEAIASIEMPSVDGLATESYVDDAIANIEHPTVDLEPYAKKTDLPSLEGLATESYVDNKVANLINAAPETLDTLGEVAAALAENQDVVDALNASISNKANKDEIPSIEGLASETYVDEAIAAIKIPEVKPDISVYEITSESAVLDELVALLPEGVEIHSGDVMLVSNSMGVKSAYQFDEEWVACDGNVDASRVIMPFDITLAGSYERVGNLSKTSTGTATFATKGKSVATALQEMLSKREQPSIKANPSVSLTSANGAKEVGTKITPTWSATLNAGSYTYGPATGITASKWEISDGTNTASTASGSFPEITVGDNTNYKITAKATYAAGTVAKDNLGDPSNPIVQIAAGNKSKTGSAITGYRAWFMYVGESLDTIDSAFIRGTTNKGATQSTQSGVTIPAGTKRVMVAIPANGSNLTSVIDVDGMGLDVFGNFTKINVDVEGLNGYKTTSYDVWVAENENGLAATHYNLVIE